jgi:hypothetical protein
MRQRSFDQPIMELVNGTFGVAPQVRLVFGEVLPQSVTPDENFKG